MPISNDKPIIDRKYAVFISTNNATYTRTNRLILVNARKQIRSDGKAQFVLLRKNRLNEEADDEILVDYFVRICDGAAEADTTLSDIGNTLWYGRVTNVTSDIFKEVDDAMGSVIAEEIGSFASQQPIVYGSYPFYYEPKIFNPFIDNKFYGNKDESGGVPYAFRTSDYAECLQDKEFLFADKEKVWTLENVIRYISSQLGFDVVMPWERDNQVITAKYEAQRKALKAQLDSGAVSSGYYTMALATLNNNEANDKTANEAKYQILKDYTKPRSYDHFIGKPITEFLNGLIDKPLDWYFDPTSTLASIYGKLVIINTSPSEVPDVVPAAAKISFKTNENTTNVNISESNDTYDRIIVRGDNILFAGTFGTWQYSNNDTLAKDWKDSEELSYVAGDVDGAIATSEQIATAYRQQFPDVYTAFKFNSNTYGGANADAIQINKLPFTTNQDRIPFFPYVEFRAADGISTRSIPIVYYSSWSNHQTPDRLHLRWAEELPQPEYSTLTTVVSSGKGHKIKPFVIATGMTPDEDTFFFNLMFDGAAGVDTAELSFYNGQNSGIKIKQKVPETCAWKNENLFLVSGVVQSDMSTNIWSASIQVTGDNGEILTTPGAGPSTRNPNTSDYKFLTHWGTYLATVAGYSKQRFEIQKNRTDENGAVVSVTVPRIKIIEDTSLQLWMVHPGTVMGISNSNDVRYDRNSSDQSNFIVMQKAQTVADANTVYRDQPKIYRSDMKKAKEMLNAAAGYYFIEKRSLKYEEALMNYVESVSLGDMLGELLDGTVKHALNTSVYSIEYDASSSTPRALISTALPEVPILTRIQQQSKLDAANALAGNAVSSPRTISPPKNPVIGAVTGGAGGATSTGINVYTIVRGETLLPSGLYGVNRVAAAPTSVPTWLVTGGNGELLSYMTYPSGVGLAQNVIDGTYVKVCNIDGLSFLQGDAIKGNAFSISSIQVSITGAGMSTGTTFYPLIYGR